MVGKRQNTQIGVSLLLAAMLLLVSLPPVWGYITSYVPTSSGFQWFPSISGNHIVWSDNRNGGMDIYLYDIAERRDAAIATAYNDQYMPRIYGDHIVWMDKRNMDGNTEKWDIYMFDLVENKEIAICTSPGSHKLPSIWADRIVWQDERNGNSDIYLYDLATGQEHPVTTVEGNQMFPSIDGDRVVYLDARQNTNFTDIYYYDLVLEKEFPVWIHNPNRPAAAGVPVIFGDKIIWDVNWDNGNAYLYMYHIATGQTSILAEEAGTDTNRSSIYRLAVYGNWIAYTLYKDGIRQVKVWDIDAGKTFVPVPSQLGQDSPSLWGNTLVWQDKSGIKDKIGYITLVPAAAPASPFFDTEDHWSRPWVESLANRGLVKGLDDGTFRPDSLLTRAQFCQMLANSFPTQTASSPRSFPDVDSSAWYAPAVQAAVDSSWMIGFDDGSFRPNEPLTKAQAITTLTRTASLPLQEGAAPFADVAGHWSQSAISAFFLADPPLLENRFQRYIAPRGELNPDQRITRGQAAMLMASALRLPMITSTPSPTATPSLLTTVTPTPSATLTPTPAATTTPTDKPVPTP